MTDMKQQVRKTLDSVTMPPLIGPLADLPDHVKQVVEAYGRACAREAIDAALRAAPEGFVLVPVEPTEEMKRAGTAHVSNPYGLASDAWAAMLAARPQGVMDAP